MITTDRTVVNNYIPGPQGYRIPLFDLEARYHLPIGGRCLYCADCLLCRCVDVHFICHLAGFTNIGLEDAASALPMRIRMKTSKNEIGNYDGQS